MRRLKRKLQEESNADAIAEIKEDILNMVRIKATLSQYHQMEHTQVGIVVLKTLRLGWKLELGLLYVHLPQSYEVLLWRKKL